MRKVSPKNIIYVVFPVILLAILYAAYLPFNQNYIGNWHDIYANTLYFSVVSENYFVSWNNLFAGGFPLVASPHSDKYYLLSVPFYLLFKDLTVVNYLILAHILLAYFTFFKFGTLITKNYNLLLIFSLLFAFSGVIFGRFETGHHLLLYGLAWIPLIYYFAFKIMIYDEATIPNVIFLAIASAMMYFTGDVYHFIYTYMIIGIIFLYYAATNKISRKTLYRLITVVILVSLLISIKIIPDIGMSNAIIRQDPINPLQGGGSIEEDLASFVSGSRITSEFSKQETTIMIGILPILLLLIGLIYGRKEIAVPSYLAILFSIVWAAGGKTVLSFIHLFPVVNNFRVPGRIFGAVLPLVLFIALYGAILLLQKTKSGESFDLSPEQKRNVHLGVIGLVMVKLLELPYLEGITAETLMPVILVGIFIGMLYFQKGSFKNILAFFTVAIIVNVFLIWSRPALGVYQGSVINPLPTEADLIKLLLAGLLLAGFYIYLWKSGSIKPATNKILCGLLLVTVLLVLLGNIGYVKTFPSPLENSPAPDVIQEIKKQPSSNVQLWVLENGWAWQHMDFTYWDVVNGIHPMNVYQAYYLKTMPLLTYAIGNVTYFSADYIIDTQTLENGEQNLPEYTFKIKNISVYKPEKVLPNVFVIRNEMVYPLAIERFSSGEVIASGDLLQGDVVILKGAYYPGWKANGRDAEPVGNMIGTRITGRTDKIRFVFDPLDYKVGAFLTGCGIILIGILIIKRKELSKI
jgi:hypothetical protein